ncbi:hypothetical protein B0H16DRAFT_1536953, partial [Mycena metata]
MDILLPVELQRDIFELASRNSVEQVFYESVIISSRESGQKFLSLIEAKPPGFFATAVKSLLIAPLLSDDQTAGILTACCGIESLALWGTIYWGQIPDFPHLANQLPLRRLSHRLRPPPAWLSSLTHLDIAFSKPLMFGADGLRRIVDTLQHLHRLTHLALHYFLHPSIVSATTNFPGLQVLVIIFDWPAPIPASLGKRYSFDDRIVVVQRVSSSSSADWEAASPT